MAPLVRILYALLSTSRRAMAQSFKNIEDRKGLPMSKRMEEEWASELLVGDMTPWKE